MWNSFESLNVLANFFLPRHIFCGTESHPCIDTTWGSFCDKKGKKTIPNRLASKTPYLPSTAHPLLFSFVTVTT